MLQELATDLWVTGRSLRFGGVDIGTRMTVIRLADGALFLHSPVALDPELRKELDVLGQVRFAVGPNRFHHLYLGDYAKAYPEVTGVVVRRIVGPPDSSFFPNVATSTISSVVV